MSQRPIHQCQCELCQSPQPHADKEDHHRMNVLLSRLNEQHRRWYVALEAERIGHGVQRTAGQITGMNVNTIRRGRRELNESTWPDAKPTGCASRAVGGQRWKKKSSYRSRIKEISTTTSLVHRQMDRNG